MTAGVRRQGAPEVKRLRDLAAWYRGGSPRRSAEQRQARIEWAAILDRLADEEERRIVNVKKAD